MYERTECDKVMIHWIALFLFPFFFAPFLSELPVWVMCTSGFLWAFAIYQKQTRRRDLPSWIINIATLAFSYLVYREFKSILGPEAGSSTILILLGLKFHDIKKPGDFMTILFTYLILIMNMLLFSQTLSMTTYSLFLIVVLIYAFMSLDAPEKSIRQIWKDSPKILSTDTFFALPLFLAMFFLFPRFNMSFGNILASPKTTVGFSGDLNPGEMATLATSEEVAFRAMFPDFVISPKEMYWRGQVLTETDGFGWKKPYFREPNKEHLSSADITIYNVVLEPRYQKTIFALEDVIEVDWTDVSRNRIISYSDGSFETQFPLIQRSYYQGRASLLKATRKEVDADRDLQLPDTFSANFKKLAKALKRPTARETSNSILNFFRVNKFAYTTTTAQMSSIDDFLFTYKSGFCEHFASAFAVLMRAAGFPARVVIGFQGGEYNEYGDYILVKEKFAHAWTEVFDQSKGWIRIDPTAVINRIRIDTGQIASVGEIERQNELRRMWIKAGLMFDSINNAYMLFMLRYNYNKQIEIFDKIGFSNMNRWKMYLTLAAVVLVLALAYWTFQKKILFKKSRFAESYSRFLSELERNGFKKRTDEGTFTFANKVSDPVAKELLLSYTNIMYGPSSNKKSIRNFIRSAKSYKFSQTRTAV